MLNPLKYIALLSLLLMASPTFAQVGGDVEPPLDEWGVLTFTASGTSTISCDDAQAEAWNNALGTIEMLKRTFTHVFVVSVQWSYVNYGDYCWAQCKVTVSVSGSGTLIDWFEQLWGNVVV